MLQWYFELQKQSRKFNMYVFKFYIKFSRLLFKMKNKANGANQFAPLSTKSNISSPAIGLIRAVENAQRTHHNTTYLLGFTKTIMATIMSIIPI